MQIEDLELVINILNEIETSRELTKEEINLKERYNSLLEFDKIQLKFNEDRKAFNEKMEALSKKDGE